MPAALRLATLALIPLFVLSWTAPLLRAGLLPLFGMAEISVLSGLAGLWRTDPALAALVALFALVAPVAKLVWLAAIQAGLAGVRGLPLLHGLGRLAMADVFLVALYITLIKGMGAGRVETGWGLWLFTGCILASLALGHLTDRAHRESGNDAG